MKMEKYIKEYELKLKYFGKSKNTINIYSHYWDKFLEFTNKYPSHIVGEDYSKFLFNFKFTSVSQQNQIINALKFGYEKVLNKKYEKVDFDRPKKEDSLPNIIPEELISKIVYNKITTI